jgi:hypothetical protein
MIKILKVLYPESGIQNSRKLKLLMSQNPDRILYDFGELVKKGRRR